MRIKAIDEPPLKLLALSLICAAQMIVGVLAFAYPRDKIDFLIGALAVFLFGASALWFFWSLIYLHSGCFYTIRKRAAKLLILAAMIEQILKRRVYNFLKR